MKMIEGSKLPIDQAVRYLLNLPDCDREQIESRLFSEDGFAEVLEAAERDLLDRYVRRELPTDLRKRVETELLFDERQRDKLRVAQALAAGQRRTRTTFAAAAVAAAIVLAAGLTYMATLGHTAHQVAVTPQSAQQTATRSPQIFTVLLTPGVVRGSPSSSIQIPRNTDLVRLELAEIGAAQNYAASLVNSSGLVIWHEDGLQAKDGGVTLSIPAKFFGPGQFRLNLTGQPPRSYHFRVL